MLPALLLLAVVAGCGTSSGSAPAATTEAPASVRATDEPTVAASPEPAAGTPTQQAGPGTALTQLAALVVRGRAPMTGYARDRFGQAWLDADRNGCDTRNDVLGRDLGDIAFQVGTRDCVALTGELADPYTATTIPFRRGAGDAVDIDHVVALGNAWASGAWRWDVHERAALANDPLNLLAVDVHTNRQKGDGDAATWLPPARGYRCTYVARQVAVKAKYGLSVTPAERDAVRRVLARCPDLPAVGDPTHAAVRVDQDIRDPGPPSARSSTPDPATPRPRAANGADASYRSCDAVRAAGAAPIHRGEPGYSRSLDRDGDGTGCE